MNSTAHELITHLQLVKHPEGGYFREIFRSPTVISRHALPQGHRGDRSIMTSIYFLLPSEEVSRFHRLKSEELWFFHSGSPLTVTLIDNDGQSNQQILGENQFQMAIPANTWFAASVNNPKSYTLVSCVVAPGFDFQDFELASQEWLLKIFPQHSNLIILLT